MNEDTEDARIDETPLLKKQEESEEKKPFLGAVLAFFSSIFFTLTGPIVQKCKLNFSDGLLMRYFFQSIILISIMKYHQYSLKKIFFNYEMKFVAYLFLQSIFNGLSHSSDIVCFNFMPIGDATAIMMSSPIPVMILSKIFLGQDIGLFKVMFGSILYTGLILVVQPSFLFKNSFAR